MCGIGVDSPCFKWRPGDDSNVRPAPCEASYYIDYFVPTKFSLLGNLEIVPDWNLTSAHITSNLEELADESL